MNKSIKAVYVAVHNNKIMYASTNLSEFARFMKSFDPGIGNRNTIKKKLDEDGVAFYTNKAGAPYAVYFYINPDYRGIKYVLPSKLNNPKK